MNVDDRVCAVVLTYNSTRDLPNCLDGLLAQRGVDYRIVVVDNASHPEDIVTMEATFRARVPDGIVVDASEAQAAMLATAPAVFLRNKANCGYSAGNNIGARLAVAAGCDAVLIANPDVRLADPDYLAGLWRQMRGQTDCVVGASRILNLEGVNENPLRELTFWEELFWIRQYLPAPLCPPPYVPKIPSQFMAGLMARCDELGAIVANPNLALGDTIRIVSGPFAETIGKIERVTDNERVQILMELMGQTTRVLVRKSHLEKL